MAISSNSVIHYTNKLENLKGILESQGFRLKYCLEKISINNETIFESGVPMISFCDIPLSEVKNHIDLYGSYAIGLYKTWAKKSRLNPVLYLEDNSVISNSILSLYDYISDINEMKDYNDKDSNILVEYLSVLRFYKNYEGKLKHGKIDSENYRFYDEREWRYVPDLEKTSNSDFPFIIWGDEYASKKQEYNENISNHFLNFDFKDISYIIVDDESDIPEILSVLNTVYEDICTSKELKVLSTRIITKNQIYNDF